ncbi:hypothetical protein ACFLYI_02975 [Chloroflexota bacterium]
MTDEELQQTIQDISGNIDALSDPDKPPGKEEEKRKRMLLLKKEVLERMKVAREKGDTSREVADSITYGILTSFGDKHPLLLHLALIFTRTKSYF